MSLIVDSLLTFMAHVNAVVETCNYHIWSFQHIRHLMSQDIAQTLVRSNVMSKLDYSNANRHGSPRSSIPVLQKTQNSLARVVLVLIGIPCSITLYLLQQSM